MKKYKEDCSKPLLVDDSAKWNDAVSKYTFQS